MEAPALADPDDAVRDGPGIEAPRVLRKFDPEYSPEARAEHIQGTVVLQLVVNEKGRPIDVTVMSPLGFGLDELATAAVQRWEFSPGTKGGMPVKVLATIEVNSRFQGTGFDAKTERRRSLFNLALATLNKPDATVSSL